MNPIQRLWSRYMDADRQNDVAKQMVMFKKKLLEEGARNFVIFPVIDQSTSN